MTTLQLTMTELRQKFPSCVSLLLSEEYNSFWVGTGRSIMTEHKYILFIGTIDKAENNIIKSKNPVELKLLAYQWLENWLLCSR